MRGDCLSRIDIAILAGGRGTRIQGVHGDIPKILIPVHGRPFLDFLLGWLAGFGARRIVLCLGHLADKVEAHLKRGAPDGMTVETAVEPEPLGTAGALRLARPALRSDPVMVLNGDSWVDADLCLFVESHRRAGKDVSLQCAEVNDASCFGTVDLASDGTIERFREKIGARGQAGTINAGIYLFAPATLDRLAEGKGSSLEYDFLQSLPPRSIYGCVARGSRFVDIGTPEGLERAGKILPAPVLGERN